MVRLNSCWRSRGFSSGNKGPTHVVRCVGHRLVLFSYWPKATREPEPGGTHVNVTSWPAVVARARMALSERAVVPLLAKKLCEFGSNRKPLIAPDCTTVATRSHSVVVPPSTLEVKGAPARCSISVMRGPTALAFVLVNVT